jgi:S1-C subfamily serine protease
MMWSFPVSIANLLGRSSGELMLPSVFAPLVKTWRAGKAGKVGFDYSEKGRIDFAYWGSSLQFSFQFRYFFKTVVTNLAAVKSARRLYFHNAWNSPIPFVVIISLSPASLGFDYSAAQVINDINSIIRKAPRSGIVDPKGAKSAQPETSSTAAKADVKSDSGSKKLSYNEISDLGKSATVLVLIYNNSGLHSLGSGFFISETRVFTNSHVVADSSRIDIVTSDGAHHDGKIVSISDQKGGRDFAVVDLKEPQKAPWLKFSTLYEQLMPVYAFGFPYIAIADDPNFGAIARGDMRVLPHIVASSGNIQQIRENDLNAQVIMHSAKIAGGNSGGPLMDACGRVIGVNTYSISEKAETQMSDGSKGETKIDTGYAFSISSEEISRFLVSRNMSAEFEKQKCNP